MTTNTEIKTWEDRAEAEHGFIPGDAWKAAYMAAEIVELRAALAATAAELEEWRFTNRIDELQRENDRLRASQQGAGELPQGEAKSILLDLKTWMADKPAGPRQSVDRLCDIFAQRAASVPAEAVQYPFGYVATQSTVAGTTFRISRVLRERHDAQVCADVWKKGPHTPSDSFTVLALYATVPQDIGRDAALEKAAHALLDEHKEACLTDPMYALLEMSEDDEETTVSAVLLADLFRALAARHAPLSDAALESATKEELWAEIWRLRYANKGPDGFDTWKEAAVAERIRRVKAEATPPANVAQAAPDVLSAAAADVLAERRRQMEREGFSSDRDDGYTNNELAHAAATYAYPALFSVKGLNVWPWGDMWFKVRDHRRNMIKAGALIIAEIERLDRAGPQTTEKP